LSSTTLAYYEPTPFNRVNGPGRFQDPNMLCRIFDEGVWAVEELEKLGVPMRWDDGEFYDPFLGVLRVHWQNVKPILAAAVKKRGVKTLERTVIVDLLTNNGTAVGATAVNTRTGEFIVIKAKATVIATGLFARCYNPETPLPWNYKFRYYWCPSTISGDGWAVAYRAGAELANMDLTGWFSRIRDDLTLSYGNFGLNDGVISKILTWDGEEVEFQWTSSASKYAELDQKGKTPLYHSLEHLPEDWHKRMEVAFVDERLVSFKIAEERGFNPKKHRYELMPNKPHNFVTAAGISTDEGFNASVKGVFATGDCVSGLHGCNFAAVSGFLVGDNMPAFVNQAAEPILDEGQVESQKKTALAPLSVKDGTEPMELECTIRHICAHYVGQFKSEGKLREGLRRIGTLRREFLPKLMAKNPHYLMRALECRNIMDLAEVHINACLERKETRGNHIRVDYPEIDPARKNMLTYQRMEKGKAVLEIRKVLKLKPEYAKGGK